MEPNSNISNAKYNSLLNEINTSKLPKFSLEKTKYDYSTISGRIRHFFEIFDFRLLAKRKEDFDNAIQLLEKFKNNELEVDLNLDLDSESKDKHSIVEALDLNKRLQDARTLIESSVHPQTNRQIFAPFRFCAFVPLNIPICIGMLTAVTPSSQFFQQQANQSYNVCVNYANGNKTNPQPPIKIFGAYAGAVTASCSIVYALGRLNTSQFLQRRLVSQFSKSLFKVFCPYAAVAVAGVLNAILMRYNEATEGVFIKNEDGEILGSSCKAGRIALGQVAITRIALPIPIILLPGLIMKTLEKTPWYKRFPNLRLPFNTLVITMCLQASLPCAIGLFPQTASASVADLEHEFQNLKRSNGQYVERVYFNKGL